MFTTALENTSFRWKARYSVLAVLFGTWIVCFMDRMVLSTAIPYIADDFHLSPIEMGMAMSAFFFSYALSQIPGGILGDKFGITRVMSVAILWWSAFTALTGAVANLTQMIICRILFGLGEGIFPACSFKTISTWFPTKERATANGVMLASNSLGQGVGPLFVVAIMAAWGWRAVFYSLFIPGMLAVLATWTIVKNRPSESKRVTAGELAEIESHEPVMGTAKPRISDVFKLKSVWLCFVILLTFNITQWGFAAWLPTYLVKARGFTMIKMGIAASLPFFAGTIGCILGGWLSDKYCQYNRKIPIICAQLLIALCLYVMFTSNDLTTVILCQTLAGGLIFFVIGAFWALPMNSIPKEVMGTAAGVINMAGQLAAFLSPLAVGFLVEQAKGSFNAAFYFLIGGCLVSALIALNVKEKKRTAVAMA